MAVHRMLAGHGSIPRPARRTCILMKQKIKLQIIQVTLPGALPPQYPCPPIIFPTEKKLSNAVENGNLCFFCVSHHEVVVIPPSRGFLSSHGRGLVAKRNHPAIPEIDPVSSASAVFPPDDLGNTDVRHGQDPQTFARHQSVDDPGFGCSQTHDRLGVDV